MSDYRLVALDLDGTLVDSAPDLAQSLGYALDSVGLEPPSLADTRGWIGDGVQTLVRRALKAKLGSEPDADLVSEALAAFMRYYQDHLFVLSELYPDVQKTLQALANAGVTVGCATNKPEKFAIDLLGQAGIGACFEFVYGGDSFSSRKPDPESLNHAAERFQIKPQEAVMVGDSANDLKAASGAGFDFIFASYGYAKAGDPALVGEMQSIDRFSELQQLLCGR